MENVYSDASDASGAWGKKKTLISAPVSLIEELLSQDILTSDTWGPPNTLAIKAKPTLDLQHCVPKAWLICLTNA